MQVTPVDETQSSVVVRDKDARIKNKSNGLVTSEKEPVKTVGPKKTPKSQRNGSQDSQSQGNVSLTQELLTASKCKLWHLKNSNIVALGTVYKSTRKQMLHNQALPNDCYKVSIDSSLVDANQVVLDEEVTPPTTIQKISDYNSAQKLQSKRKSYVSRKTMQRQARTGKSHNIRSADDRSKQGMIPDADDADIRINNMTKTMGRVDQYPEQCQVKSPMLDSSLDNQTTDYSKQSLESENILLKKTVAQFQKDFSRMEAHCIALKLKYQNQALKSGQHGQILNETSNKAKIKKEIDVLETMNIELEHSVAKLRKENETLKKHYKDLYDSIKITRSKTIEQTTSLLANNVDLKAQIQEKVFAIAALKNDLRKLKGNSVDTKFAKTSVLGKPVLQSLRNQSVVRQPNAFKSERPQMSTPRFASQVDVSNNLSRRVTQHYLPRRRKPVFEKPYHMIAFSESRNSSKNMPRFSSNDMVHNHYLDEARKKTQERER
ncbi:hypothetical protein Tco_0898537 [Tanacetum coccineum]